MIDQEVHLYLSRATTRCGRIVVHGAMYVIWPDESFEGKPCNNCFVWAHLLEQQLVRLELSSWHDVYTNDPPAPATRQERALNALAAFDRRGKTLDYFLMYGGIDLDFNTSGDFNTELPTPTGRLSSGEGPSLQQ